jgi:amino acid transporter
LEAPVAEEGFLSQIKRLIVGEPIPSHLAHHERLSRFTGLAILSSDPLSSVAYATEEILRVLILVGVGALSIATPIAFVIAAILAVVVFSYRQTIHAYPSGGGAYIVAKENLGETPALIAAAALLIDYVLTVAVSIAAGVAALTSAFPDLHVGRVEMTLVFVLVLMLGNLRGIRESGRIFSIPTYFFVISLLTLIGIGAWRVLTGAVTPVEAPYQVRSTGEAFTLFLMLTAFSNGCTAMTGVEAVSNGVPAFRPPEARNAAATMVMMAVLAITMFTGITLLAHAYQVIPSDQETVVSQIARGVFGGRGVPYYLVQVATMLILVLAANTAYADFPRLASILARDRYVPRQLMNQGDRLAFSNGIVGLSIFAGILLVVYGGDTHSLIPRIPLVHLVAGWDGGTLAAAAWARMEDQRRYQRARRRGNGSRPDGGHGDESARRRLDHSPVDSRARVLLPLGEAPLRQRGGGTLLKNVGASTGASSQHGPRAHQRCTSSRRPGR